MNCLSCKKIISYKDNLDKLCSICYLTQESDDSISKKFNLLLQENKLLKLQTNLFQSEISNLHYEINSLKINKEKYFFYKNLVSTIS